MNIYEVLFIIAAILVSGGGTAYFGMSGQYIGAGIFLVVSILCFVVFGLRWFGPQGQLINQTQNWPPALNTCPDFLTYFNRPASAGTTQPTCVDTIGVSRNGAIQKFPADGATNPPAGDNYYFRLISGESRGDLCTRLTQAGLTWEGIYDGENCLSQGTGQPTGPGSAVGPVPGCPTA
jgi:hypothetical protein